MWVYAVTKQSSLDLSHFLPLRQLESLETDWFYVAPGTNSRQIIGELTARGVAITIGGVPQMG